MSKYLVSACLSLLLLSGCAASQESESTQPQAAPAVEQTPQAAPEPAVHDQKGKKKNAKKDHKKESKKHEQARRAPKSEAEVRAALKETGHRLVLRASRTITPSKSNKAVRHSGNGYVATYISIDPENYSTDMRPASKAGQYVGFIRYSEQTFSCHGKTKAEALKAPCQATGSRRLNEMIHFDGHEWRY
ncbi:MAG: translation initiation factor 2 [Desulfovibrio sp.]|nr:translation initiation factor 2 [Desulfovibrio sp.]